MKITIDGITFSHLQPGGYRTYTTNLIRHLSRLENNYQYVLFLHKPVKFSFPPNWFIEIIPASFPLVGVAYREQIALPRSVNRLGNSLLHSPCATGPITGSFPRVVTLLDTIEFSTQLPIKQPRLWLMQQYSRLIQTRTAYMADQIITISNYSKSRIVQQFGIEANKITVTHLAVDERFGIDSKEIASTILSNKFGLTNYVLALASASPRKNINGLLLSYALLNKKLRQQHKLLLVSTHTALKQDLQRQIVKLGIENDVIFLQQVSDEDLIYLYKAASLFVFLSLEEGFGLPPLEAMACGTPVVASNTSSLPEVLGDAAILVTPTDTKIIAEAITTILTTPFLANEMCDKGLKRNELFSWEKTARETLAVYKSVLSS